MSLKEVFCQDKAISILHRSFANEKVPHAYIFAGRQGVGKFKTAAEWSKLLLCEEPVVTDGFADSCEKCQSCRLFKAGSHPDFQHVYKELLEFTQQGKGKKTPVDLSVDVIREFLVDKVSSKPTLSKRRIFVVSEAEKLNTYSQNCLLKVLEEPPGYCCIILLCTQLDMLLATVKSRCQIVRFGPVDELRIIEKLQSAGIESQKAKYLARLSQGSLGQACQWAELELAGAELSQIKNDLITKLANYNTADALDLAEWIIGKIKEISTVWVKLDEDRSKTDISRQASETIVQMIVSVLLDVMKLNFTKIQDIINYEQKEQIEKLARRFDSEQAAEKINACYRSIREIDASVNEKLIFEQLLLSMANSDRIHVLQ